MKRNKSWVLCVLLKHALWPLLTKKKNHMLSNIICWLINNTEFLFTKKMHGRIDGWGKTLPIFYLVLNCQENSTFPRMLAQEIMRILEIIAHIYNKFCTAFSNSKILSRSALSLCIRGLIKTFFSVLSQKFRIAMTKLPPFIIWKLFLHTVCNWKEAVLITGTSASLPPPLLRGIWLMSVNQCV